MIPAFRMKSSSGGVEPRCKLFRISPPCDFREKKQLIVGSMRRPGGVRNKTPYLVSMSTTLNMKNPILATTANGNTNATIHKNFAEARDGTTNHASFRSFLCASFPG